MANGQSTAMVQAMRGELREKNEALSDLLENHVADVVGGAASTALTWAGAGVMGAIDGALGANRFLGPVPISAIGAAGLAVTGLFVQEPNAREAINALARGIGAPMVYEMSYRASLKHFHPDMAELLGQVDAASAATQAKARTA